MGKQLLVGNGEFVENFVKANDPLFQCGAIFNLGTLICPSFFVFKAFFLTLANAVQIATIFQTP